MRNAKRATLFFRRRRLFPKIKGCSKSVIARRLKIKRTRQFQNSKTILALSIRTRLIIRTHSNLISSTVSASPYGSSWTLLKFSFWALASEFQNVQNFALAAFRCEKSRTKIAGQPERGKYFLFTKLASLKSHHLRPINASLLKSIVSVHWLAL